MGTAAKQLCSRCHRIKGAGCECVSTAYNDSRPSAWERGYDRVWCALRKRFLAGNPLCSDCSEAGRTEPAVDVHHKIKVRDAPHLRLEISNLLGLCKRCHSIRTARGE